jgi:curved DNA-binding protein CbpA
LALQSLDLPSMASLAQIENSYRTMVKVWHPDRFQTDPKLRASAEEKLKEINAAHEYLLSNPAAQSPPVENSRATPPTPPRETSVEDPSAVSQTDEEDTEIPDSESAEIRRILKRQRRNAFSVPKILLQTGYALGAVAMVAILWFVMDAILSSNPRTAAGWDQYKAEISRDMHASGLRLWSNATENMQGKKDQEPTAAVTAPQQSAETPESPKTPGSSSPARETPSKNRSLAGLPHIKVGAPGEEAQSYITSGLTPTEVLAILGNPTSSSGEKMFYKGSEIDFRNGRVAGWKIDSETAPVAVRLWPRTGPVPGLTHFGIGSTKSDVINLQGTPSLFSDNKFGYGSSVVFFQNDRVVGWNEDPNSTRLRVAR